MKVKSSSRRDALRLIAAGGLMGTGGIAKRAGATRGAGDHHAGRSPAAAPVRRDERRRDRSARDRLESGRPVGPNDRRRGDDRVDERRSPHRRPAALEASDFTARVDSRISRRARPHFYRVQFQDLADPKIYSAR